VFSFSPALLLNKTLEAPNKIQFYSALRVMDRNVPQQQRRLNDVKKILPFLVWVKTTEEAIVWNRPLARLNRYQICPSTHTYPAIHLFTAAKSKELGFPSTSSTLFVW